MTAVSGGQKSVRAVAGTLVLIAERLVDRCIVAVLRPRPGWEPIVVPYVSYGSRQVHVRGRVMLGRRDTTTSARRAVISNVARFLSAEIPREPVLVQIGELTFETTADSDGYVEATFDVPMLEPGWHTITFRLPARSGYSVIGRLVVADPRAQLGIVSDIDDTIIHTGLTRLIMAIRTTFLTDEADRLPIRGAAQFYQALVSGAGGSAEVFYVSTGAWNLHSMVQGFLARHGFPEGPVIMTDWGPSEAWLFREASVSFKARMIGHLVEENPRISWVLVGDSGQDDPDAYAEVADAYPDRIHAIYIRDVPPRSPARDAKVRRLIDDLAIRGVPMLLIRDSLIAADHARTLGLLDATARDSVAASVNGTETGRSTE